MSCRKTRRPEPEAEASRAYRAVVIRALRTLARAERLYLEIATVVAAHRQAVMAYGIYVPPLSEL